MKHADLGDVALEAPRGAVELLQQQQQQQQALFAHLLQSLRFAPPNGAM
jgi:hypothetical protein